MATMLPAYEEKEVYVLLDFQGEETLLLQQDNINFRMLNLNEPKPIVQMGEDVYEGTYEDAVGTNVYFEENKDSRSTNNIFECKTPISLKYVLKQSKVLKLKKIGTGKKFVVNLNPIDAVDIQFKEDYQVLLQKFVAGTLNIDDCVLIKKPEEVIVKSSEEPASYSHDAEEDTAPVPQVDLSELCDDSKTKLTSFDKCYQNLQKLISEPINYKSDSSVIREYLCKESLSKNDFSKWRNSVMERVAKQHIKLDIKKENLNDFVNVKKSIEDGIIANSNNKNRVFTKQEKEDLVSFKNFINVSPILKLLILGDYLKMQKLALGEMSNEQLNAKDEDMYSFAEKFEVMKEFKSQLKSHIMQRLQEASSAEQEVCLQELGVFNDNLSDTGDDSSSSYESDSDSNSDVSEKRSTKDL